MSYTTVSETVAAYDEMLNDSYGAWPNIGSLEFAPSDILRELDPVAYKCGWLDWCDSEGIDTDELEDDYTFTRDTW